MADDPNPSAYKDLQRDLVRTAIKQPLLAMILDPINKDQPIDVIIEANDNYYAGKKKAEADVQKLVKDVAKVDLPSIGSDANPYYKTNLTPQQILDIVDQDDKNADKRRAAAQKAEAKRLAENPTQAAATPPGGVARYLVILRIWYNHKINP